MPPTHAAVVLLKFACFLVELNELHAVLGGPLPVHARASDALDASVLEHLEYGTNIICTRVVKIGGQRNANVKSTRERQSV